MEGSPRLKGKVKYCQLFENQNIQLLVASSTVPVYDFLY